MGFFDKLKKGLNKTRENLTQKIEKLVIGYADIDDDFLDELEETLIMADVGVQTTEKLMAVVRKGIKKKEINSPQDLKPFLAKEITAILTAGEENDKTRVAADGPTVMLVIGVNGAGKTTTIGKLSAYYKEQGKSVMLAAADTFRAAAIDQLEVWGQRTGAKVIKHEEGSDPAAVAFDAVKAAKARGVDILIVDTAGRLQTKSNLMQELEKINRVIGREIPGAPHEPGRALHEGRTYHGRRADKARWHGKRRRRHRHQEPAFNARQMDWRRRSRRRPASICGRRLRKSTFRR